MNTLSARDLTRRWYGQIKAQPPRVASDMRTLVAHSIIPDFGRSAFGMADLVPLSGVLDVVLHSEINSADEVVGTTVKAYRASFDPELNQVSIGGATNFRVAKDLRMRPFRGAKGRVFDPVNEPALLLTAMEMEAEREAVRRRPSLQRYPRFAEVVLSFAPDDAPSFEETEGLQYAAWELVQPNAYTPSVLLTPEGYDGKVTRIVHDSEFGVSVIELEGISLGVEVPYWARLSVKIGEKLGSHQRLASLQMPKQILTEISRANHTWDTLWDAFLANVGDASADLLLRIAWYSSVFSWAGLVMAPHHILPPEQVMKTCAAWRDLRGCLGRVCHNFRDPNQVIRSDDREGRISVWDMQAPPDEQTLVMATAGGSVDFYNTSVRYAQRSGFISQCTPESIDTGSAALAATES